MFPLDHDDKTLTDFLASIVSRAIAWILVTAFRAVAGRWRSRR